MKDQIKGWNIDDIMSVVIADGFNAEAIRDSLSQALTELDVGEYARMIEVVVSVEGLLHD
ncbi:MAG: hypothetical protein GX860_00205 [Alcaligenaceae bacterium]|jgi:hypothetical protein|nr:hypothetical protein [Alcaligenaceae bacterium]